LQCNRPSEEGAVFAEATRPTSSAFQANLRTLRLLQLASPTLPVGAYSYSQGLEHVVEQGIVTDEASATSWIEDLLQFTIAGYEAPMLLRMLAAARANAADELQRLNAEFLASRETAELRAETAQMGHSLARLLSEIGETRGKRQLLDAMPEPTYPCAWACAAAAFDLPSDEAHAAYLWSWLENQVMAAVKLVPLGQTAGQRMLLHLGAKAACASVESRDEYGWTNFAPGLAIASALHETQYTRLFRS